MEFTDQEAKDLKITKTMFEKIIKRVDFQNNYLNSKIEKNKKAIYNEEEYHDFMMNID